MTVDFKIKKLADCELNDMVLYYHRYKLRIRFLTISPQGYPCSRNRGYGTNGTVFGKLVHQIPPRCCRGVVIGKLINDQEYEMFYTASEQEYIGQELMKHVHRELRNGEKVDG